MTDVFPSPVAGVLGWAGQPSPDGRRGRAHPLPAPARRRPPPRRRGRPGRGARGRGLSACAASQLGGPAGPHPGQRRPARRSSCRRPSGRRRCSVSSGPDWPPTRWPTWSTRWCSSGGSPTPAALVERARALQAPSPRLLVAQAEVGDDARVAEAASTLASLGWMAEAQAALGELDRRGAWTPERRVLAAQVVLVAGRAGALELLDEGARSRSVPLAWRRWPTRSARTGGSTTRWRLSTAALAVDDGHPLALAVRAITLAENETEGTIPALARAVEVAARPAFLLTLLGSFLAAEDRLDEAIAAFDRALEGDPTYGPAHLRRSRGARWRRTRRGGPRRPRRGDPGRCVPVGRPAGNAWRRAAPPRRTDPGPRLVQPRHRPRPRRALPPVQGRVRGRPRPVRRGLG